MQRVSPRAFLLTGAAIGALVVSLLVVFMLMGSSAAPKAQAIVPTKTPTPGPSATAKPVPMTPVKTAVAGSVNLGGLFDACAGLAPPAGPCTFNPSPANTLYACMVRVDEAAVVVGGVTPLKSMLECGSTAIIATGAGMPPCGLWHGPGPQGANLVTSTVAGEGNCGTRAGYGNGPGYTSLAPYKLQGFYCDIPAGCPNPHTGNPNIPQDGTWQIGCLADFGTALGPNVVVESTGINAVATNQAIGGSNTNNATVYVAANNASCTIAQGGGWPNEVITSAKGQLPLITTLTRRDPNRVYCSIPTNCPKLKGGPGSCTDMEKLGQIKPGKESKCPWDPFNPHAVQGSSDVSGTWNITAEAVRADRGAPGLYYNCDADIQQVVKALTARILCVIDSAGITVNPQVASGNPMTGVNNCLPTVGGAAKKFCGDGQPGAAPPGCDDPDAACATLAGQGAGCPALPCNVSQYQFADIDNKQTVLTGVVDNTANTINLAGCFISDPPEGDGLGALGNVYVVAKFNIHTGQGKANIFVAETRANCIAGTPLGGGLNVLIAAVRQSNEKPGLTCTPNVGVGYSDCRDSDGDGCPDKRELGDTPGGPSGGGLRDPGNPFDMFNPEKVNTPHSQTVADILYVVGKYGKNQGNAAYTIDADRTALIGGNVWNLGPPDGQQSVADILAAVKQYNQNC